MKPKNNNEINKIVYEYKQRIKFRHDGQFNTIITTVSLGDIRHQYTNYDKLVFEINNLFDSIVANRVIHLLQNFINKKIDDARLDLIQSFLKKIDY